MNTQECPRPDSRLATAISLSQAHFAASQDLLRQQLNQHDAPSSPGSDRHEQVRDRFAPVFADSSLSSIAPRP
ncbi:unnamed protein product [Zymoseptoria tritici ST99CH_3D1]|uniref:Uncharacterized protein n=1 Tax=Zymoseptoria tritici ST99CH_1E4 TaxID=1276532 RepID=A0A2H1GTA9_ZYMTR|nr:unnamed protein product [Zymoseptoria tritici ST99CH_1E4]SMR59607.1 unnamed protein product [Zymoseptoria tritici ST99CH_3D1]